jgi:hypothetical protein
MDIIYATNDLYGLMARSRSMTAIPSGLSPVPTSPSQPRIPRSRRAMSRYRRSRAGRFPVRFLRPLRGWYVSGQGHDPGQQCPQRTRGRLDGRLLRQETALRAELGEEGVEWEIPPPGSVAADGGPALYRLLNVLGITSTAQSWLGDSPALWNRTGPLGAVAKPVGPLTSWRHSTRHPGCTSPMPFLFRTLDLSGRGRPRI